MDKRVLGVDIGGTSVKMGIHHPQRGMVEVRRLESTPGNFERMADQIVEIAGEYRPDLVGVGTAGRVNSETGLVNASNLGWRNVPLRHKLEAGLKRPVWVDNDAQAALTAEWYDGACDGAATAVYLTLGTGIGGAVLIGGKPWRGHDNTAFELGHIITHGDGLPCPCSKQGCFERYASAQALSRLAGGVPANLVIDGILAGDPAYQGAFREYLHELGIGLVSLISLFRPQVIAIGGGVSAAGDALLTGIRREIRDQFANHSAPYEGRIELARHKNSAGMIGAAVLARLYLDPGSSAGGNSRATS